MIDLETLSSRKNAAVIQLAAVRFDPHKSGVEPGSFNAYVWHKTGHISISTIAWWMQQPNSQQMGRMLKETGKPAAEVLLDFATWLGPPGAIGGIWSHGASFDLAVLTSLYDDCSLRTPWEYKSERDTRSIFWLVGGAPDVKADDLVKHEALSDCTYQVRQIQDAVSKLKAWGVPVPV
jgi:exodeoxyribonuclease VIII